MGLNFKCIGFLKTVTYSVKCKIKAAGFIPQTLQLYKSSTLSCHRGKPGLRCNILPTQTCYNYKINTN
jgi:hypothetical protein